ncbi:FAD-dependent oxidoreductase [Streptomyces canarius]
MAARRPAAVIGAGIGGLSAALALHQHGWEVTVFERAAALEAVGSGLGVAPNALRALDVLGVGNEVRTMAARQGGGGLRSASGRWLARTDLARIEQAFDDPVAVVPRPSLIGLLADRLPSGVLRTSTPARVVDAGSEEQPARIRTGRRVRGGSRGLSRRYPFRDPRRSLPPPPRTALQRAAGTDARRSAASCARGAGGSASGVRDGSAVAGPVPSGRRSVIARSSRQGGGSRQAVTGYRPVSVLARAAQSAPGRFLPGL